MRAIRLAACFAVLAAALPACTGGGDPPAEGEGSAANPPAEEERAKAIFAAGCFWCVEQAFDEVPGVKRTVSGYTGGHVPDPSYEQVTQGGTGHREAVLVDYDPDRVSYRELLDDFWLNVDPTDDGGQFCDRGASYESAIFVFTEEQRRAAEASKEALEEDPDAPSPIVTPILEAGPFYEAEDYHQNYYQKNPLRYEYYKYACGRQARLEELWGEAAGGAD